MGCLLEDYKRLPRSNDVGFPRVGEVAEGFPSDAARHLRAGDGRGEPEGQSISPSSTPWSGRRRDSWKSRSRRTPR